MKKLKSSHKIGAVFYILWGVLHIIVGIIPVITFLTAGSGAMLAAIPGVQAVPATVDEPLRHASYLVAQHYFNLAAFGVLAIIIAVTLNWRNRPLGFWTNLIVLGMVDLSFILGEIVPGYMPLAVGLIGPVLYVLGALFTGIALVRPPIPGQQRQA